jgi:hypothetical protein
MNISKLLEALDELVKQRSAIDSAITHLHGVIGALAENGSGQIDGSGHIVGIGVRDSMSERGVVKVARHGSHFDNAFKVLAEAKEELHISGLIDRIGEMIGHPVGRASVEGALSRHIRHHGERAIIIRTRPSTYALNPNHLNWPRQSFHMERGVLTRRGEDYGRDATQ